MKKLLLLPAIAISLMSVSTTAPAADSDALRICEYIAVNDKNRLRSFLKSRKLKIRTLYDSIQCNGQNILVFAAASSALDTGELFIKKLSKKVVEENISAVEAHSAHLAAKSRERIQ
jgi:hypothetical protein